MDKMEEIDNEKLLLEIIQLLRRMIAADAARTADKLSFAKMLHHLLVMADDYVCDENDLSRKAKGKYLDRQ